MRRGAVALVFGTRPEIIKLSSVIRALVRRRIPHFMVHTGQHYSFALDRVFFRDLELPEPQVQLSGRSRGSQAAHAGRMMAAIERVLLRRRPAAVLLQGDTNSVLAGALAASKIPGIRIGHVEAGLRSYDRSMPEEINRIAADHVSDFLFPPTAAARRILLSEGIAPGKIHVTGNTIVDAVRQNLALARQKARGHRHPGPYFLITLHRQENVDDRRRLGGILEGLDRVWKRFRVPMLFPVHPRTRKRMSEFKLRLSEGIRPAAPAGFLEFLRLEADAALLLTDSGGVQEEGCILRVPCVTLRTSTERPETVSCGANRVAGCEPAAIVRAAEKMIARKRKWRNPFGDGRAGERIVNVLRRFL